MGFLANSDSSFGVVDYIALDFCSDLFQFGVCQLDDHHYIQLYSAMF